MLDDVLVMYHFNLEVLSSQMMYDEKLPYIEDLQRYRVLLLLRYEIVREPLLQVLKLIIVVCL